MVLTRPGPELSTRGYLAIRFNAGQFNAGQIEYA